VFGTEASWPESVPDESGVAAIDTARVEIAEPPLCPRYTARVIRGVKVGPSPEWVQSRLTAVGQRPINNIVDATNLVMFEVGQPLHAFDMDTLAVAEGKTSIIVRRAAEGERLVTLDGQERALDADMVVIADPGGAVALAGVMGGAETEVCETTTNVLLESASFDPAHVSRTSRSLGLISEASSRFEKRVDPEGCAAAADRCAELIARIAGGEVAPGIVDSYPLPAQSRRIELRVERLNAFLGIRLEVSDVVGYLERLGLSVEGGPDDVLCVEVPTWRPDLEREVDLFEEVVRLFGMSAVEGTLPTGADRVGGLTREQRLRRRIGSAARAAGLNEVTTYSFVDPADVDRLGWPVPGDRRLVSMLNPMSEEQSVLRPTIAGNLMRAVSYNQRRDVPDVHLYEIGTVFLGVEGEKLAEERRVLAGVLAGWWARPSWNDDSRELGLFDGKGAIESVMEELHVSHWTVRPAAHPWLHPGRSADVVVNGAVAGWLGEAHPDVLDEFDTEGPVTLFELDVAALVDAAVDVAPYRPVPRFPSVNLDIAVVLPADVPVEQVLQVVRKQGKSMLEDVRLFDVYEGEGVPSGRRSLAFSLVYRHQERTLTDEEVQAVHAKVVEQVCSRFGGELRG
jgi:phenylalanyl-tRNA synthetase beta chain